MSTKGKRKAAGLRAAKGKCRLCQQQFASDKIEEHLNKCLETKFPPPADDNKTKYYLVKAYAEVYWLYLKAPATATLQDLDYTLRRIWLECCGHMSTFNRAMPPLPKGKKPSLEDLMPPTNNDDERDEDDMGINKSLKLEKVFKVGDCFDYEYDMGTTTELAVDVLAEKYAPRSNDKTITILARNNHPMIDCTKCDDTAKKICSECFNHFCTKHSKHDCDSEMLLSVANSPRSGSCGYEGNTEDEGDRFPKQKEAVNIDEAADDDDDEFEEDEEDEEDDDEVSDD